MEKLSETIVNGYPIEKQVTENIDKPLNLTTKEVIKFAITGSVAAMVLMAGIYGVFELLMLIWR